MQHVAPVGEKPQNRPVSNLNSGAGKKLSLKCVRSQIIHMELQKSFCNLQHGLAL